MGSLHHGVGCGREDFMVYGLRFTRLWLVDGRIGVFTVN